MQPEARIRSVSGTNPAMKIAIRRSESLVSAVFDQIEGFSDVTSFPGGEAELESGWITARSGVHETGGTPGWI
jgi:hypothetical protein